MKIAPEPYLDYLHCLECGYVLCTVVENEGRTAIDFTVVDGTKLIIFRAVMVCPACKAKREFYSEPMSGKRIGVV